MSVYWIKYRGTRFPVRRGETILGRSPYCTIVVSNGLVSREHSALTLTSDGLSITDLGSTNGTKVNGVVIAGPTKLTDGDVIGVGADALEVIVVDPSSRRAEDSTRRRRQGERDAEGEDSDTETYRGTLDLVERLVASASESSTPLAVLPTLQKAIAEMLTSIERRPSAIATSEVTRIAAVVAKVVSWAPSGELDAWRDEVLARLEKRP